MASESDAPESSAARTPNCVECNYGREHTICHVLHLVDAGWVVEHSPHGPGRAALDSASTPATESAAEHEPRGHATR